MNTYDPKDLSSRISCNNMSYLSYNEAKKNGEIMDNIFRCNMVDSYADGFRDQESSLIKGSLIGKKSCIYKRPEYNMGDWENQFMSFDKNNNLFNNNTKAKTITKLNHLCKDQMLNNDNYNLGTTNVFTNQFAKF